MTVHEKEFVGYDGEYPCLCHGQLAIKEDTYERESNILFGN